MGFFCEIGGLQGERVVEGLNAGVLSFFRVRDLLGGIVDIMRRARY